MSEFPPLPRLAMLEVRRALAEGDAKHGEATRYEGGAARHFAGARRHAARRELGETVDLASGAKTIAHEIARLMCALEIILTEEVHQADELGRETDQVATGFELLRPAIGEAALEHLTRIENQHGAPSVARCDCVMPIAGSYVSNHCGSCGGALS